MYFLHLARTGGSAITRLVDDAFPAGTLCPHAFVDDLLAADRAELDGYGVFCGHLGVLPLRLLDKPITVVTVVREPAARAWSHYRMLRWSLPATAPDWDRRRVTFADVLADPGYGAITRDFQARWLAVVPERDLRAPEWPGLALAAPFGPGTTCEPGPLAVGAERLLERGAVVGTTERLADTIEAMSRLIGRRLGAPPVVNPSPRGDGVAMDRGDAAEVRRRSPVDVSLLTHADRRLDATLEALPALTPASLPLASFPYEHTMDEGFTGTGWHGRAHRAGVGWHRWSGPGTKAAIRLPVRVRGRASVELHVVATAEADTLDGVALRVQGRPAEVAVARRGRDVTLVAECDADDARPFDLELVVRRTAIVHDAATGRVSAERAGVALTAVRLADADADQPGRHHVHLRSRRAARGGGGRRRW